MAKGDTIPWEELSKQEKRQFAGLCNQFVDVSVEESKRYYGNKEQLIEDMSTLRG